MMQKFLLFSFPGLYVNIEIHQIFQLQMITSQPEHITVQKSAGWNCFKQGSF